MPAPIENLPVELLQPIFFDSGYNLALVQASHRIGLRLSSAYVYHATCAHFLTKIREDRAVQSAAQTCIFASKWMTWSFLKSWIHDVYAENGCLCGLTPKEGCFDAQWPPNFENPTKMVFSRSHLPRLAFIKARLPKKLLRGPWTPEKVHFLQFLLWLTSMTVDWSDSEVRKIAIEGRLQAIREKNLEAVELFNHNRRLGRTANLSMIKIAVLEGGCDRSIVYDMLATASLWGREVSWESAELDKWCEEHIKNGDPKGLWLKTKLEELRHTSKPDNNPSSATLLDRETGDYDGGLVDQLIVRSHNWNQVSVSFLFFELFFHNRHFTARWHHFFIFHFVSCDYSRFQI